MKFNKIVVSTYQFST